jgi:hypothetical protein
MRPLSARCVCVLLLVFKSNVMLSSFLQHALLVHRIAKQHCELSFGAGGNERVLGWKVVFWLEKVFFSWGLKSLFFVMDWKVSFFLSSWDAAWSMLLSHRSYLPPLIASRVVSFFRRYSWKTAFLSQYYTIILTQGPRPYALQPLVHQFLTSNVPYNPIELIVEYLVARDNDGDDMLWFWFGDDNSPSP